jgi:hypothetical protein
MRWTHGKNEALILNFTRAPSNKENFRKPRSKWNGNIVMDLNEIEYERVK